MSAILGYQLYQSNKSNKELTIKIDNLRNENDSLYQAFLFVSENTKDSVVYRNVPGRRVKVIDSIPYPIYVGDTISYKRTYEESSITDDYSATFKITTLGTLDNFDWKITDYNDTIRIPYPVYKDKIVEKQIYKNTLFLTASTPIPSLTKREFNYVGLGVQVIFKNGIGVGIENKFVFKDKPIQEIKLLWNPFQKMN